jgi:hypothetical protein
MAGETSVAEEEMLAQYFRTHEVDKDWGEYKEMFALFDNGQVDIEPEAETSDQKPMANSQKPKSVPMAAKEKPKIATLRWLMAGIAASIALLLVFYLGRSTAEQPTLMAEETVVAKDSILPKHEAIAPIEKTVETVVAQTVPAMPGTKIRSANQNADSASAAEELAKCIARLEAEMANIDDSVSAAHLEKLIAADARLQQMVYRIIGKQTEQALNEMEKDSTANYINF